MVACMTIPLAESGEKTVFTPCTHEYQVSCGNCRLNSICLPLALESDDIQLLDDIIQRSKPLQKNQHLYREGDDFQSVYAVRSGTLKAYKTTDDGREQVTGFYFPGEILGMDGISNNTHASSAKALETAAICEIPFSSLEKLSASMPNLQRHISTSRTARNTKNQNEKPFISRTQPLYGYPPIMKPTTPPM